MKKFYVYELWNPIKDKVFYVGKTYKKSKRYIDHLKVARKALQGKYKRNYRVNTILSILAAGLKPIEKIVFETNDEREALDKEIALIKFYGRADMGTGILTNHTDGGDTTFGYKRPIDWKETCYARLHLSKPIYAINPDGTIFKEFISTKAVDEYFGKDCHSQLSRMTSKNKHYTLYGYFWRYKDQYDSTENFLEYKLTKHLKNACRIAQIDINTLEIIKIWQSINELKQNFEISKAFYKHLKSDYYYKGYYWCNEIDNIFQGYDTLKPYAKKDCSPVKIILSKNEEILIFDSKTDVSKFLKISRLSVDNAIKNNKFINEYKIEKAVN